MRHSTALGAALACSWVFVAAVPPAAAQRARIHEETRTLRTYAFSEPNPVPMLVRDTRLYPYHGFEGYSAISEPREWQVVVLENDYIEVFVLPEVGGKVWGAVVKETGHEFIYRNEVVKFRNIALRGPWTSGGIEFNFGVIGHTPATATPVDYLLRENPDGSVSCFVGAMDLPSRTHWRVEIRLPADRAYFETNVLWYNPTSLEQPYYNWMTAAAFAQDDLELAIPGDAFLQHSGRVLPWPVDSLGRDLSLYANNTFEGHKSYHVVGELNDFFGGYYLDDDYGFGHWARYEEMPGQKLWLWALSREGGIWEDLLTDTDGQYVEFQAGRLFVQYSPGADVNPITQAGFEPMSASRWSETWFPVEGIGGISDASREGALHVDVDGGRATVGVNAFRTVRDTLRIWSGERLAAAVPVELEPLEPFETSVEVAATERLRVDLAALDLHYDSDPSDRLLSRPFATDPGAVPSLPEVERMVFEARELQKARRYPEARPLLEAALEAEPWHSVALLALAELEARAGKHAVALSLVNRVLELDAYHAQANFVAGTQYRALGRTADAVDAFGWAARSVGHRSAAYAQLAEVMIGVRRFGEAIRYARLALDFDRYSVPAWRALAVLGRVTGDAGLAAAALGELSILDPLHHFVAAERHLADPTPESADAFVSSLGGEYPGQTRLELAVGYASLGRAEDALELLTPAAHHDPVSRAWRAFLMDDPARLRDPGGAAFVFPFRTESLSVLEWAAAHDGGWLWRYLLALNLWAVDRSEEAASLLEALDDGIEFAPAYVARAHLLDAIRGRDPVQDLQRAVELDPENRILHVYLVRHLLDREAWDEATGALAEARARFPEDFNLALMHVRALIHTGGALEATGILRGLRVLPSENARESHRLYAWAHTLTALDALEVGDDGRAQTHAQAALEWPESLGQGRPYAPEERLPRFVLALAESALGNEERAREEYLAVVEATELAGDGSVLPSRLDLLGLAAQHALGRPADLDPVARAPAAAFEDLEGRMVLRALRLRGLR